MVAYQHFVALANSSDANQRGEAAHLVAMAFVACEGPADEQAALYASVLGFLDDPSVKVRASLAFGLLHSKNAPRLVMLALVKDAPIIARAVLQYSPVLIDVDLLGVAAEANSEVLLALVERDRLSERLVRALANRGEPKSLLRLLKRLEIEIPSDVMVQLVQSHGENASIRGALLDRSELSAFCRLQLVEKVKTALLGARIVKGAVAPDRLARLMRDALDSATTRVGEAAALSKGNDFAVQMRDDDRINTRILLHSVVHGHVLFFADCVALISDMPAKKVFSLLESGSRVALNALFSQCGMSASLRNLLARLVLHAREADLSNDDAARHFVVSALIEELIIEHDGDIPQSLEEAFRYLDEQNMVLARSAARGVMPAFSEQLDASHMLLSDSESHTSGHGPDVVLEHAEQLALPAA